MKRTFLWPPVLEHGGATMTPDPATDRTGAALRQLIRLMVQDCASTNPWNAADRLGVDDPTWSAGTVQNDAILEDRVRRHLRRLEDQRRARLVAVRARRESGDLVVDVEYDDLEVGRRDRLEVRRDR